MYGTILINSRILKVAQIYSTENELINHIQEGNWTLHDFFIRSWGYTVFYTFEDPFGEIRREYVLHKEDESAGKQIQNLLIKLREFTPYKSWSEYEMSKMIKELSKENESLRKKLSIIKQERKD